MHLSLVYVLVQMGAALVIGANVGGKLPNRKALAIGVFAFVVDALLYHCRINYSATLVIC